MMYYDWYRDSKTVEDITIVSIGTKVQLLCNKYKHVLESVVRCSREETLMNRYHTLNEMEDTVVLLIAYAKRIAKTESDCKRIARMEQRYTTIICDRRDAIIIG
jgi:hypothetical protein